MHACVRVYDQISAFVTKLSYQATKWQPLKYTRKCETLTGLR